MDARAMTMDARREEAGAPRAGRQPAPMTMGLMLGAATVGGFGALCALVSRQPAFLLFIALGAGIGWCIGAMIEGLGE